MKRYGLFGPRSGDFLTFNGRVLVHGYPTGSDRARAELEFLFPDAVVREVPPSIPAEQTFPLPQHPSLAALSWPLDRREFRGVPSGA